MDTTFNLDEADIRQAIARWIEKKHDDSIDVSGEAVHLLIHGEGDERTVSARVEVPERA